MAAVAARRAAGVANARVAGRVVTGTTAQRRTAATAAARRRSGRGPVAAAASDDAALLLLGEHLSQLAVLLGEAVLVLGNGAVDFLEAQDFVFQGLDVEFFALAVGALGLAIEFLASGECRAAVGFGAAAFRSSAICLSAGSRRKANKPRRAMRRPTSGDALVVGVFEKRQLGAGILAW